MARLIQAIDTQLPDDYYLQNFLQMVTTVKAVHYAVFTPELDGFLRRFLALTKDAQQLYVRLACRKPEVFRLEQLDYSELSSPQQSIDDLLSFELLDSVSEIAVTEILPALQARELKSLARELGGKQLGSKQICLEWLLSQHNLQREWLTAWLSAQQITLFKICGKAAVEQLQLLFYASSHRDLSDFVLSQMGVQVYESYPLSDNARLFETSSELMHSHQLVQLQREIEEWGTRMAPEETVSNWQMQLGKCPAAQGYLHRQWQRVASAVARQQERHQRMDDAIALYQQCSSLESRQRLFRLLLQVGKVDQAESLLAALAAAAEMTAERQLADKLSRQLARARGTPSRASNDSNPTDWPRITLSVASHPDGAEQAAIAALEQAGQQTQAFFVENRLFQTVCGLYFWEEIFADLPGAFTHPFQDGPHDLNRPQFYLARWHQIEFKLEQLRAGQWSREALIRRYLLKEPLQNRLVHWRHISLPLLRRSLDVIPDRHWYLILARMIRDLPGARAGLPDLICFQQDGNYQLVEVKGPGDRLQDSQRRWLSYFCQHQIPVLELHLSWCNVE